jgi:glycine dehydrogenase
MRASRTGGERSARSTSEFAARHVGPRDAEIREMLDQIGAADLDQLVRETVPASLLLQTPLELDPARSEAEVLAELRSLAESNQLSRSFIGLGYCECITPAAIQRGILEAPGWYTAYTPYQPEISQGRLEAMLNFQTMVCDLTGMEVANASMLDEATAAAEAMQLCLRAGSRKVSSPRFLISDGCHPQTVAVLQTRAEPLGIETVVQSHREFNFDEETVGVLVQYPATDGLIENFEQLAEAAHEAGALVVVATDLLALTLLRSPGGMGADVALGSSQRFGVPLGCGGPHAAFFAARERFTRQIPGRIVGVSRDAAGRRALRLALQTREQHIRRDKATSNICTAQVLLAVVASMYGVYHGPDGLTRIARRIRGLTEALAARLRESGCRVTPGPLFDTIQVVPARGSASEILRRAAALGMNLRLFDDASVGISLGEPCDSEDLVRLLGLFDLHAEPGQIRSESESVEELPGGVRRESAFMEHPVFHEHRSETQLMRYMRKLASRDLSLDTSMIPLGSCTMKLNAAAEMLPITWPGFASPHPFAPAEQLPGYGRLCSDLERWLAEITGFAAVSLMPNAGAQGEYAGLLVIREWHRNRGESRRDVCLIPESAHGTNPASAVMAGMRVVVVRCDESGNVDLEDLRSKISKHEGSIAALMVTYPSTHGVFEEEIATICSLVHDAGGQVYMDGANMNAMVGICRPAEFGADVCHLNLHKTFCIPHGGGGPGMGPICVAGHLAPFLPRHPLAKTGGEQGIGPVSAAPHGSPSILPISYAYIAMMGAEGLRHATEIAILNANYVARRLEPHYRVLYRGSRGRVAHECIVDTRPFRRSAGVEVDDIAKRLMDFGFHAPTMSWPVVGTLMIEPTESESKQELDRFCDAMIAIREEIRDVEQGRITLQESPLRNAPHTVHSISDSEWARPYSRRQAAFPAPWVEESKFWPHVARIDHVYGDRNVVCTCAPIAAYED